MTTVVTLLRAHGETEHAERVQSAKNAGMLCVAVETTLGKEYLQDADVIIQDIRELPDLEILGRLNARLNN